MASISGGYIYGYEFDFYEQGDARGTAIVLISGSAVEGLPLELTETDPKSEKFEPSPGDILQWGDTTVEYVGYYWSDVVFQDTLTNKYYALSNDPVGRETIAAWMFKYTDEPLKPVCFVKGTLIETTDGAKPIESLSPGEKILCLSGWREVKWIGWRSFGPAVFRTNEQRENICPVLIRAGALGQNCPTHDIRVSPWHHVYLDGVLVRAIDLINGQTIIQDFEARDVSYYHIELDRFDVLLAHGMYSESWADGGNRDFFQNVDVSALSPTDMTRRRASRPGFKVVRPGDERLVALQTRLAARADVFTSKRGLKAA